MNKYKNFDLVEYAEYVSPDGVRYPMFGGNKSLVSWEGVGVPDIDYIVDSGPFQHGVTVRDYKYQSRNVTFKLFELGRKRKDFYKSQKNLINAARPTRAENANPGFVKIWLEDGNQKEIEARLSKGPIGDWGVRDSEEPFDMMERVTFFCGDPFWRDVDQETVNFSISTVTACLGNSLCFPFCAGSNTVQTSVDIVYGGTWFGDQVTIEINGPINTPTITNKTTGKSILLNYNVQSEETVTISLSANSETVTSDVNGNLIGAVDSVSDFVDWNFVPSGELSSDGTNTIEVFGSGGESGSTSISISYYTRYLSIYGGNNDSI